MRAPSLSVAQCAVSFHAASQRQQDQIPTSSTGESLEVMDLRLQRMADFKAFFDDCVHGEVVKHVRHRNALLPIGMLPTELLQEILNLLLFTTRGRRKSRFVSTITTLRAVSWSWWDLLGRTPTFWTHVSSEDDIRFVSEALEISDQAPLHIRHIGKYPDGPESPFLDKVLPHSHRWESVTIHQPNTDVAAKYFSASAPIIKSFLLSSLAGGLPQPEGLGSVFGGRLENLEELRVAGCGSVGWKGLSCTRLCLLDIGGENSLDMAVMLDIVAANPNLEVIRLHNLTFAQYLEPKPNPAPIHLKNLKELTLKDITHITEDGYSGHGVPTVHILQRIQLGPNIAFNMKEKLRTNSFVKPEKFISLIPTPVAVLAYRSQTDGFQSVEVNAEFAGKSILLEIQANSRSKPIFSVEVDGLPQPLAKNWMVGGLEEATRTPMDLRLHFANVPVEPTLSLDNVFYFQLWESVKNLSLDGNFQSPPDVGRKLLRLLSTRCMAEDGSWVMPFPKLQNLHLSGLSGIKAKDMLEMVRARFAPPGSTEAAVQRAVPVPMTIYCGNGVGGWRNKYMDDILATPGVKGVKGYEEAASSSSSSSPESEWPPPYDFYNNYHSGNSDWDDSEISLHNSDAELSLHDSDAEDDVDDI